MRLLIASLTKDQSIFHTTPANKYKANTKGMRAKYIVAVFPFILVSIIYYWEREYMLLNYYKNEGKDKLLQKEL